VGRKRAAKTRKLTRETIGEVTPDDMYHGRQRAASRRREKIQRLMLARGKKENSFNAAWPKMAARTLSTKTIQLFDKT
jgi:hypothetical protein